ELILKLIERKYLYKAQQRQLYSETEKRFLTDRAVEGECPICHYPNARGDQCDNCGNLLDALDLINPRSKTDGSKPIIRETEHYFLDLKAFVPQLQEYLGTEKEHWRPNVLAVSRNKVDELVGISGLYAEGSPIPINLPYDVPANEFMNIEGQKFSKSRNWAVWIPDILTRYDPDAIRYCVAAAFPESKDADFSWSEFVQR